MKWFKVHGLELITGSRFQNMTDTEKGMWLTAMSWASVNDPPGQIPARCLPFSGKKLEKFRTIVCKSYNFFHEKDKVFYVTDWSKFQSDYELYQKGKNKPSKELRKEFVIEEEEEVEVDKEKVKKEKDGVSEAWKYPQKKDPFFQEVNIGKNSTSEKGMNALIDKIGPLYLELFKRPYNAVKAQVAVQGLMSQGMAVETLCDALRGKYKQDKKSGALERSVVSGLHTILDSAENVKFLSKQKFDNQSKSTVNSRGETAREQTERWKREQEEMGGPADPEKVKELLRSANKGKTK